MICWNSLSRETLNSAHSILTKAWEVAPTSRSSVTSTLFCRSMSLTLPFAQPLVKTVLLSSSPRYLYVTLCIAHCSYSVNSYFGTLEGIRTPNLHIRSVLLCPVELQEYIWYQPRVSNPSQLIHSELCLHLHLRWHCYW
jgi:hypothetical protein